MLEIEPVRIKEKLTRLGLELTIEPVRIKVKSTRRDQS
jgi:hypothetical protein